MGGMRPFALFALAIVVSMALAGCGAGGAVDHAIVGGWGVRTQSGELVPAFSFEADGTFEVFGSTGTGLPAAKGSFTVLDESSVQAAETARAVREVIFEVDGETLTVKTEKGVFHGFERMENE